MTPPQPPRIVLDTNVCLDLLLFRDPGCAPLMGRLRAGALRVIADAPCRDEWLRVLRYPKLALDDREQSRLVAEFDALIVRFEAQAPAARSVILLPRCRDPDDQKFLELARDAEAAWLFTKDQALLRLSRRTEKLGLFRIALPTAEFADGTQP